MFSCKKASQLISLSLDRELTWKEWYALRFHTCICSMCRRFEKHVRFLQKIGESERQMMDDALKELQLPADSIKRMQQAIEKEKHRQ